MHGNSSRAHRVGSAAAAAIVALAQLALGLAVASAQPSGVSAVTNPSTAQAGWQVRLDVTAPDGDMAPVTATVDPLLVGAQTFVRNIRPQSYGCPTGRVCFNTYLQLDVRLRPGRYTLPVTLVDRHGRARRVDAAVTVVLPLDSDADGMPDAWEQPVGLNPRSSAGDDGPDGDPDGDGVSNFVELQRGTPPRARFVQYFAEASLGQRQRLDACVDLTQPDGLTGLVRVTFIGDDGRRATSDLTLARIGSACPLLLDDHVADRVVAALVESEHPVVAERRISQGHDLDRGTTHVSAALAAPSTEWHFAEGTRAADTDVFYLTFNPHPEPVEATLTFYGAAGGPPVTSVRTLPPGVRTTLWVNADEPRAAAREYALTLTASAPILVERAMRWNPPGKTVPHDSVSAGATAPSTTWYFPHVLGYAHPYDTEIVLANPGDRPSALEARAYFTDARSPATVRLTVPARGRQRIRVRDLGFDSVVGMAIVSTSGVPVVAELVEGGARRPEGSWARVSAGEPHLGSAWAFAAARISANQPNLVFMNPSDADLTLQVVGHFLQGTYDTEAELRALVTVPARRTVLWSLNSADDPARFFFSQVRPLVVTSVPGADGVAPAFLAGHAAVVRVGEGSRVEQVAGHRLR